jgi:arabinan endo-1,5-alpha-L-arabinosidase
VLLVVGLGSLAVVGDSAARAAVPPEGCVLVYPQLAAVRVGGGTAGATCSYVATQVASFVGTGPFHIRVSYEDSKGAKHVRFDVSAPPGQFVQPFSGLPFEPHQVGIGDHVDASVTGPGGFLAVGNPGAPPSSGDHTPPPAPRLRGDVTPVHDPAMAFSDGWYYLFTTGAGIGVRRSRDLVHWQDDGKVFSGATPTWAPRVIPGARDVWAPDVSFFDGSWRLYYAVSTFGSSRSAIGLATNATLDRHNPAYAWHDHGPIIQSCNAIDPSPACPPTPYNAIDPNVVIGADGVPHLEFGSFTAGLVVTDLDASSGRPRQPFVAVPVAANVQEYTGVEGGYMVYRSGWYYLFGSYDYCCQGAASTYDVRVGRSRMIEGPFLDDLGVPMLAGGGRYVLTSNGGMRGPGGEGVIHVGSSDDIFFHYYDASNKGTPTLGILRLAWTPDGWPVAVGGTGTR